MNVPSTSSSERPARDQRVLCVASRRPTPSVQTFVANHLANLPFDCRLLYGSPLPCFDADGRNLMGKMAFLGHLHRLWPYLLGVRSDELYRRLHRLVVARHLRRSRARAVLAEFGWTGVGMLDACRAAEVPIVVHFHGNDAYSDEILAQNAERYRELFAFASAIVAVSTDMEKQLVRLGAPPDKVHRIVYGIDLGRFEGADPRRSPPSLLAVGRFVEKKAPQLTLLAFAAVLRDQPAARLRMIGDGPLLGPCRAMVEGLGIGGSVELLGLRTQDEVAAAMKEARAFVQHSLRASDGDSEGAPLSILEAQASGLPVISTRHAGIPEVVLEGETGLLVAERDVQGMAAAMRRMVEDADLAARLGAAGRERVERNFTARGSLDALAALIDRAMAAGG